MADVVSSTAPLSCPTVASGLSEYPPIQPMDTTQPAQPLVGQAHLGILFPPLHLL